jgi:N-glycosylase/DNA lyase
MKRLLTNYTKKKKEIRLRLKYFKEIGKSSEDILFSELAFCICTPQSKAKKCDEAILELKKSLLYTGNNNQISKILKSKVRFHNNKAKYIIKARNKLYNKLKNIVKLNNRQARDFLVKEIKGISMKEASHFLRNIGKYENITILDRHILKNLKRYGIIKEVPKALTRKIYLEIENKMLKFCKKINIPPEEIDLLFWSNETDEIFK